MENLQKNSIALVFLIVIVLLLTVSLFVYKSKKVEAPATVSTVTQPASQTQSTKDVSAALLTVQASGGLCQYGGCSSKTTIRKDGTFAVESGDGETKSGNVSVNTLQGLIEKSDYTALRKAPFVDVCPTAYDGTKFIYTFQTSHGEEIIDSCQTKIATSHPLFREIQRILTSISSQK